MTEQMQLTQAKGFLARFKAVPGISSFFTKKSSPDWRSPNMVIAEKNAILDEAETAAVSVETQAPSGFWAEVGEEGATATVCTFADESVIAWCNNSLGRVMVETHDSNPCACTALYGRRCS